MAISYGFDLNAYTSSILASVNQLLEQQKIEEFERLARIEKARAETIKVFLDWTELQAALVANEQREASPQRSGNLKSGFYTKQNGNDWEIGIDDNIVVNHRGQPYAQIVMDGRGPIAKMGGGNLRFKDTRKGWQPFANLSRVTGGNSSKYPYMKNIRKGWKIPSVGPAPAIGLAEEGFDRWESLVLPGQIDTLRQQMIAIISENGGSVEYAS